MRKPPEVPPPWLPATYDEHDVLAIQALVAGTANDQQQKRVFRYIVETVCGAYDLSYRPNERDTAFAEGKRYVGLTLVKLARLNVSALFRRKPDE